MKKFLVAIPVYNERKYLQDVVGEVRRHVSDILLIDDGSTDGTRELIRHMAGVFKIFHAENRGYGQAMISAFAYAQRMDYTWLITIDCDEQHEPDFLPSFMEAALDDNVDVISGSRYLMEYEENTRAPTERRRINHTINCILDELVGLSLTDSFCGFKAYRTAAISRLELDIPGYAFPLQFWVQAVHHGLRIREIPVRLIYNDPNRHFGGMLDDPDARLAHYLEVLTNELVRTRLIDARCKLDALSSRISGDA